MATPRYHADCICQFRWGPSWYGYFSVRGWLKVRPVLARGASFARIIEDYNGDCAQCTFMEGDAPPEDAGGPGGFQSMLEILRDEKHPE